MTSGASRLVASRSLALDVLELLVRVGDTEARGLARPGKAPEIWTVTRARGGKRWSRRVDLGDMRRTVPGGGRALAKACARLVRAA